MKLRHSSVEVSGAGPGCQSGYRVSDPVLLYNLVIIVYLVIIVL